MDYLELKRNTSNSDSGFWINGVTLYTVQGVYNTIYRCAYRADSLYNIRVGVYRKFDRYNFIFVSENAINPIDIRLVFSNANDDTVVVKTLDRIDNSYGDGYQNGFAVSPDDPIINITVFSSLDECLNAIGFDGGGGGEEGSADIIVTITANSSQDDSAILVDIGGTAEGAEEITVKIDGKYSSNDTNDQGGISDDGGGEGSFDETSDPIPIPPLPEISSANTGLVTLFRPNESQVANLGAYLWTHFNDFWENLQKLFTNPMDYFISFNIFPVKPLVTSSRQVYIGNWGTSIEMPPVVSQWYEFDCGKVLLTRYWGSALDYAPNTRVQLMLPFIGAVQLNTDEVMGNNIGVHYRIDLLSGSCVAFVTVNDSVYYQFTGECAVSIPLTGADWSRIYSAVVGAIGTAIAGGVGIATASEVGGSTALAASRNMRIANTINNTVGHVMSGKTNVQHSGTISGSAGMLGVREPYLIVEYPNQSLADNYKHYVGYPSNIYAKLNTLQGYTECEQVIPYNIWGTDDELAEIIGILKGGVYL